jgi:hypothetical protein
MASKPHPDWTEPQKKVFNQIQEAIPLVIPYFGADIPSLDNHTTEQLCDDLGVVKQAKKAVEKVEKTLSERFKPRMEGKELRGNRFVAEKRESTRTALNQGKCKGLLAKADELGVDLQKLLGLVEAGELEGYKPSMTLPTMEIEGGERVPVTNTEQFNSSSLVEALYVEPIA